MTTNSSVSCDCPLFRDGLCSDKCNGKILFRDIIGHLEDEGYTLKLIMKFLNKAYDKTLNAPLTCSSSTTETVPNRPLIIASNSILNVAPSGIAIQKKLSSTSSNYNSDNPDNLHNDWDEVSESGIARTPSISVVTKNNQPAQNVSSGRSAVKRTHADQIKSNQTVDLTTNTTNKISKTAQKASRTSTIAVAPGMSIPQSSTSLQNTNTSSSSSTNNNATHLSSLESTRLANIARNAQFMASIGIEEKQVIEKETKTVNAVTVSEDFDGCYGYNRLTPNFKSDGKINFKLYEARLNGLILMKMKQKSGVFLKPFCELITPDINKLMGLQGKFELTPILIELRYKVIRFLTHVELSGSDLVELPDKEDPPIQLGLVESRAVREVKQTEIAYKFDPIHLQQLESLAESNKISNTKAKKLRRAVNLSK